MVLEDGGPLHLNKQVYCLLVGKEATITHKMQSMCKWCLLNISVPMKARFLGSTVMLQALAIDTFHQGIAAWSFKHL